MRDKKMIVVSALFIVMIYGFAFLFIICKKSSFSAHENRFLISMPELSVDNVISGSFTADYETYMLDHFPFRNEFITVNTYFYKSMLKKDVNGVYFGHDGYLIERVTDDDVDEQKVEKIIRELDSFVKSMEYSSLHNHIKIMIIPDKTAVITDKLPFAAEYYNQQGFIERLEQTIGEDVVVDTYSPLKEHSEEYIYYKTDHHYTTLGAYYEYLAYTDLCRITPTEYNCEVVTDEFYGTAIAKVNISADPDIIEIPIDGSEYIIDYNNGEKTGDTFYDYSKLAGRDKYAIFYGGNYALVSIYNKNADNENRLLIIKDSFANSFTPFVASDYRYVYMVDKRYYNSDISELIEEKNVTDMLILYSFSGLIK